MDIIDTCKSEIGIQCYPRIDNQLDINSEQWENHKNVKFHCFHFSFNFDKTIVVLGVFVSLFLRASRNGPKALSCIVKYVSCCSCCFCFDSSKIIA